MILVCLHFAKIAQTMLLLDIRNDVWLRSEEYDPVAEHLPGNFPHVFSHVGLGTQLSIWAEVSFCLVLPLWQPSIRVENAALLLSEGQPIYAPET